MNYTRNQSESTSHLCSVALFDSFQQYKDKVMVVRIQIKSVKITSFLFMLNFHEMFGININLYIFAKQ